MAKPTRIKTPVAEVFLHKTPKYVHQILDPIVINSVEMMKAHLDQTFEFTKDHMPLPILIDNRKVKGVSKEAREYAKKYDKEHDGTTKVAFLVGSGISKIMGNLFIGFSTSKYPVKVFTDFDKAKKWLIA